MNQVQLIRHATLLLTINGKKILVDPMLSAKEAMDPVQQAGNQFRIPMVELPFDHATLLSMLSSLDAVLITHLHRDHWDQEAASLLNKSLLLFCQPGDDTTLLQQGFTNVNTIDNRVQWEGIDIFRTGGQHGTGEIGKKMGNVSGFVFKWKDHSLYIAGDTIYCEEVIQALNEHQPATIVLNAGGAQFLTGDPITMTPADITKVKLQIPEASVICIHMDTVNHCFISRKDLRESLAGQGISEVKIPLDGEIMSLN